MTDTTTAYNYLLDGKIVKAVYVMYNTFMPYWVVPLLFFTFQILLYIKTRNGILVFIAGLIFTSLAWTTQYMNQLSKSVMGIVLILELTFIIVMWIIK